MKILHTEASCGWGGQEIRILEESRGLIDRGHQVSIACPAYARLADEAPRYGVPVIHLPIEVKTFAGFQAVRHQLSNNRYDVVNTHSSADSWLVALACATSPAPPGIVRTRHISAPVSGHFANRWLYRQAKIIVTTGGSLRQHLINALAENPNRIISITTGIDTKRFFPAPDRAVAKEKVGLSPSQKHVGIVATLRSWKGHLILLEAFARVQIPGLMLVIVGDGPMREQIAQAAFRLGLTDRVIMVGQRIDPENWLQAMDVFCLPSYANEGVPQALMQAMAVGLPVISTPVGAIGEIICNQENGVLVPPKNISALADAMANMTTDTSLAARLGTEACCRATRDFGIERMISQMEAVFLKASNSGSAESP